MKVVQCVVPAAQCSSDHPNMGSGAVFPSAVLQSIATDHSARIHKRHRSRDECGNLPNASVEPWANQVNVDQK
jgi:hypothetical protein